MRHLGVLTRRLDLRGEEGLALVMVMGVLFFFSIVTVTAYTMANSSQSTASLSSGGQNSYALAETGLSNALATLEDVPTNNPEDANLLGSAGSPITTTTSTGSVSWYGTYNSGTKVWTLHSTSTVPSPVGGRGALHTTLTRTVTLTVNLNGDWDRIYQDDATTCLTVPDGTNIPANITAHGDLCLNGANITGSTTKVTVGGNVILTPAAQTAVNLVQPAGTGSGWTNSQNITANDNVVATTTINASSDGATLKATNFGLNVPSLSTINGISVKFERWASTKNCVKSLHLYLLKNGVPVGTDKGPSAYWNNASQTVTLGSAADLWGGTWTAADVDSSNFGFESIPHDDCAAPATITGNADYVEITVNYTPYDDTSIGTSGTPIYQALIGGTCNYNAQGVHTPCSSADHVWTSNLSMGAPAMNKPTPDWTGWYNNAAPGPKHNCDTKTGTPPTFDNNTVEDNSVSNFNLAPNNASYTCVAKDGSGNVIGQLSWNNTTQVLTISGVIFIDGLACFCTHDYTVHYQGRGAIYATGGSHIDSQVCAGGSGATGCYGSDMSNWDPSTNLLVMVVGDKTAAGNNDCKIDETDSAFQGIYWSRHTCDISDGAEMSGPIIASDLSIGCCHAAGPPGFFAWPPLGNSIPGVSTGIGTYTFTLGPQSG
jgi:hypothetical protein